MLKRIRFISTGCSTLLGNFGQGDIARVSDEVARHLVEDVKVAEYLEDQQQETPAENAPRTRRKGG